MPKRQRSPSPSSSPRSSSPLPPSTSSVPFLSSLDSSSPSGLIYNYLRAQNRPFALNQIVDNLQGSVKKSVAQRAIEDLVKDGAVTCKEFGKSVIYLIKQAQGADSQQLEAMEQRIKQLETQTNQLKSHLSALQSEISKLESEPSDKDLDNELRVHMKQAEEIKSKVKSSLGNSKPVSQELLDAAQSRLNDRIGHWKQRKTGFYDLFDLIADVLPGKPNKFFQEKGIQVDEEMKIQLKEFTPLVKKVQSKTTGKGKTTNKSKTNKG
jgi:polyhydroxyalkanoate synthesis regulator phasin